MHRADGLIALRAVLLIFVCCTVTRQAGFVTSSYRNDLSTMGDALVASVEDMMELARWNTEQQQQQNNDGAANN